MKPIGSIRMYYTFLSEDTQRIIEAIVEESQDLHDIAERLVEISKEYPVTSEITIFAMIQAQYFSDSWEKLRERCKDSIVLKPFAFYNVGETLKNKESKDFNLALNDAIESNPEDWILFQLYLFGAWYLPEPDRSKFVKLAKDLVSVNPKIRRFLPQIYAMEFYHQRNQGDIEGAIKRCDNALEIAREYDDILSIVSTLTVKGNTVKDFDIYKGLELLDEAYSIGVKNIDSRYATSTVALHMALVYEALGEYDMALELLFEYKGARRYSDSISSTSAVVTARIFNALNLPEQSHEWLRGHSDSYDIDNGQLHSAVAHTFLLEGKLDKATHHLNQAHRLAIESGDDQEMMDYLLVQGLLDFALGNITSATNSIEQSLQMADPQFQITVNRCLKSLTRIEIESVVKSENDMHDAESSGPWMTRLRKHAHEKKYPGIKMEHALLKAEYQVLIKENEAAMQTLTESLDISDSMTVKSLRKKIVEKVKELERAKIS
ncbi:MAG: hypothetical protein ACW99G_03955 [Candidatus Thorarchaeota archaeon]